jgi:hypothetical protein
MSKARLVVGRTRGLVLFGIVASLAFAVALQWDAIRTFDWRLSWAPFAAALCLFALGPLVGAVSFWIVLRDLAPGARLGPSVWVWQRSFAARYMPSGALTVAVRLVERDRLGATRGQMLAATAFEQLVGAAAAAAVSLAAFAAAGRRPPVAAVVVIGAVLALAAVGRPAAACWGRLAVVRARALVAAVVVCACGWLVAGAATWIFVEGLTHGPAPSFAFLLGAYAFAWLVGFLVFFAPSGLGPREATLTALLAPIVGAAPAIALAVGLRLANIAGDFFAIGTVETARLVERRWHRVRRSNAVAWELP